MKKKFQIQLSHGAKLPQRSHPTDSGVDITIQGFQRWVNEQLSDVTWFDEIDNPDKRSVIVQPGRRILAKTGLRINIPPCEEENYTYEIQVRPKSGLALKRGVMIVNTPGTIDNSYQGDIDVILYNGDIWEQDFKIGQKIAQLVINKVFIGDLWEQVSHFKEETDRNVKGFGSTGLY